MKTFTLKELTVGRSKIWEQAEKEEVLITRHGKLYLRIIGVGSLSISPENKPAKIIPGCPDELIDIETGEILEPEKREIFDPGSCEMIQITEAQCLAKFGKTFGPAKWNSLPKRA